MQTIRQDGTTTTVKVPLPEDVLRQTSNPAFRIPLEPGEAENMITLFYIAQVRQRGFEFIADEAVKSHLRHISALLTDSNGSGGIMLCGNCGNGKTTLLYAFQKMLNWLGDIGTLSDLERIYGEKPGIVIKDAKQINSIAVDSREFNRIMKLKMLAIEDIGKEPSEIMSYGNVISPMQDIIEYRYDKRLFTFITTNLAPKEITARYGERIGDRLREMVSVVVFRNDSYRKILQRKQNGL